MGSICSLFSILISILLFCASCGVLSRDCTRGFAWVLCCVDWSERVWCWSLWKGYCSVVQCSGEV
jgi:hypothetical protein